MSSAFEGLPKTPNLKLNKPGYDNVADIEALNENSDILDDEINTIKSNLKNKGSATEPIYFDGNGVPQKTKNFTDYLPLAGGTMTGAIETNGDIINPSNNNTFIRIKGSKEYQQGAELLLSGKTLTDHEGLFYLIANNGTKSTKLLGKADGSLLWGAKHIVRSVNGINATPDGNVNLGIMPIANGGTGATTASQACANIGAVPHLNENNTNGTIICGGTNWEDGAGLYIAGANDETLGNKGAAALRACNGSENSSIDITPNGLMKFNGKIMLVEKDGNYAEIRADIEGGNLRLQKSNGIGFELDTCLMNGTDGYARMYFNRNGEESWTGFGFYEDGKITNGYNQIFDSVVAKGQNYIKYQSGLLIQWGNYSGEATITLPLPYTSFYTQFITDRGNQRYSAGAIEKSLQSFYVWEPGGYNWLTIGF